MATSRTELLRMLDDMRTDLAQLESTHQNLHASAVRLSALYESLSKKVEEVARLAQPGGPRLGPTGPRPPQVGLRPGPAGSSPDLVAATRQMQEMSQSFNLQYLQLQQHMQQQNRQFTLVSNIMKTKHDTAKAAINNIR